MNEPNETFDALEAELKALAPQQPSAEVQERIADRLAGEMPAPTAERGGRRSRIPVVMIGGVVAATIALAAFLLWRGNEAPEQVQLPGPAEPVVIGAFDEALPTLWQFRRVSHSPNELDAVLDRHAGRSTQTSIQANPIRGFGRSDTTINTFLGEL
jgi:hypothetical protein